MSKKLAVILLFAGFYVGCWIYQNNGSSNSSTSQVNNDSNTLSKSSFCPECTWQTKNFKSGNFEEVKAYLIEVLRYAFQGNLEANWEAETLKNKPQDKWFLAEGMPREPKHNLTEERRACLDELTKAEPCQIVHPAGGQPGNCPQDVPNPLPNELKDVCFETWAVSFYNERGNTHLEKVWDEAKKPNPKPANFAEGFPEGTVAVKVLFTQASANKKVKFLRGSVPWEKEGRGCKPSVPCIEKLKLLQVDLAVRDDRSPTGWVFGSFIYDKDAPKIFEYQFPNIPTKEQKAWLKLVPLGVIYGNKIEESMVNPKIKYGGCPENGKKRLNGPVDNPQSSCIACHSVAETTPNLKIEPIPFGEMKCNETWFGENINPRNLTGRKTFIEGMFTLDYSLQLRMGLENCCQKGKPCKCEPESSNQNQKFSVTRAGVQ